MKRHVTPVADNARARLIPVMSPVPRQVEPVERLVVEFARGPLRHAAQHVSLTDGIPSGSATRLRAGERVLETQIGSDSYDENTPTILGDPVITCVQDPPLDPVTRQSVPAKLVVQELSVVSVCHAIHVLDYECFRRENPQNAIELPIQVVYGIFRIAPSALRKALAWVAANKKISVGEFVEVADVPALNDRANVVSIDVTREFRDIVSPDDIISKPFQGKVRPSNSAKQRNRAYLSH